MPARFTIVHYPRNCATTPTFVKPTLKGKIVCVGAADTRIIIENENDRSIDRRTRVGPVRETKTTKSPYHVHFVSRVSNNLVSKASNQSGQPTSTDPSPSGGYIRKQLLRTESRETFTPSVEGRDLSTEGER